MAPLLAGSSSDGLDEAWIKAAVDEVGWRLEERSGGVFFTSNGWEAIYPAGCDALFVVP